MDDYAPRLPEEWLRRGGVLMPMHQAEAMWMSFDSPSEDLGYPFAVKIATGKVCAVSGGAWVDHLNQDPQDYVVLPDQPWLDGYCVEKGLIRQFVAMPLGEGYTVEEQLTGAGEHGGVQIIAFPMKRDRYEALLASRARRMERAYSVPYLACAMPMGKCTPSTGQELGLYKRESRDVMEPYCAPALGPKPRLPDLPPGRATEAVRSPRAQAARW